MIKNKQSYYVSELLANRTNIQHGYSTRVFGDMRTGEKQKEFLDVLGIRKPIFLVKQMHGDNIVEPQEGECEADAIVCSKNHAQAIGVLVADCVPIILADTKGNTIAVVHAGWKGTCKQIVVKAVNRMCELGTQRQDIVVSIGPRIGGCCYRVNVERVQLFQSIFGEDQRVCYSTNGQWFIDLGYANLLLLQQAGVTPDRIDAKPMCTSCQVDTFYSYRKDTKETFGEIMAVAAFV